MPVRLEPELRAWVDRRVRELRQLRPRRLLKAKTHAAAERWRATRDASRAAAGIWLPSASSVVRVVLAAAAAEDRLPPGISPEAVTAAMAPRPRGQPVRRVMAVRTTPEQFAWLGRRVDDLRRWAPDATRSTVVRLLVALAARAERLPELPA
ncbi:MAG: hypothetical protein M9894_15995 [Planctomycetes bacterium]|nr:hypothetical protein [Planctomycetota bacterium]